LPPPIVIKADPRKPIPRLSGEAPEARSNEAPRVPPSPRAPLDHAVTLPMLSAAGMAEVIGARGESAEAAPPRASSVPKGADAMPRCAAEARPDSPLFRHEALRAYERGGALSSPLRIVPLSTRILLWTLGVATTLALSVACLGQVELTARGRGVMRAREGVQPLIFETGGVLVDVLVKEGQVVHTGEPLLRLDSTMLRASLLEAERDLASLAKRVERDNREANLNYARDKTLLAQRAALTQRRIRNQRTNVDMLLSRQHVYEGLESSGLVSREDTQDTEQQVSLEERGVLSLHDEHARIQQQLGALEQSFTNGMNERAHELEQARARRDAARVLLEQTELKASREGRIESLSVSVGEVVEQGTAVARLVPLGTPSTIVAFVPERERAFVKSGTEVHVELDQLPVGEFGSARARVTRVSSEIASPKEVERALGAAAPEGVHFAIELSLLADPNTQRLTNRLGSGTLLSVRMPLRKRRIIALVFDPIRRALD
jgi:multidrug resistance efflux pump